MSGGTMTVGQLREALVAYRPETPVMIHPTGDPDDNPVPLSHLGRGALLVEGEQPRPYPMLVVAPVEPHLVAGDVPAGEAVAPGDAEQCKQCGAHGAHRLGCRRTGGAYDIAQLPEHLIRCERCGRTTSDPDLWDPEADTGRVFCNRCWDVRDEPVSTYDGSVAR